MNQELNWKNDLLKRTMMILVCTMALSYVYAQNSLKMKNKDIAGNPYPYFKIGIGGSFPCGESFSISLEDESRFIFSAASGFNVTLNPDPNELFMLDGEPITIGGGKRALSYMSHQKSFDRVIGLKVGYIEAAFGEKWAIASNQLRNFYPNNFFDIMYDGEPRTAFDQSNLFYEMLISIQVLAHKNEDLTATLENQSKTIELLTERIERLENPPKPPSPTKTIGKVSINPNPNTNGNVLIKYNLNDTVLKTQLILTDIQGKVLHKSDLDQMKGEEQLNINLSNGIYLYYLKNHIEQSIAQKLIIQ